MQNNGEKQIFCTKYLYRLNYLKFAVGTIFNIKYQVTFINMLFKNSIFYSQQVVEMSNVDSIYLFLRIDTSINYMM